MLLFTYGTLRVGQPLYPHLEPFVTQAETEWTIRGRLYHVHGNAAPFPVAKLNHVGAITGDVLHVPATRPEVQAVLDMERTAGYVAIPVLATRGGATQRVFAFHYLGVPGGAHIPSGDWLMECEKYEDRMRSFVL